MPRIRSFRDLPLFWKLLAPFLALILMVGAFGAFLIVRDLSTRARTTLTQSLLQSSLEARARLHDRELYLLESANLAANLEGMPEAVRAGGARGVAGLLRTVLALKTDVTVVAAVTTKGEVLTEFARAGRRDDPARMEGTQWLREPFVAEALADPKAEKRAGVVTVQGSSMLAIAAPICTKVATCAPAGAAIVGMRMDRLGFEALGDRATAERNQLGLAIFDDAGRVLTATRHAPGKATSITLQGADLVRRTENAGGAEVHTLFAPLDIQGRRVGMVAVSLPSDPVFAPVRGAGTNLVFILLAALAGIVGIGALLSRVILRQVQPLVETNRALGSGDLSARAPVIGGDELGELARGVNQMAEQLQASYETLEMRVAQRTEEVHRLLDARTELFAAMSHEFRTPLAVIMGQADMIVDPSYPKNQKWAKETGGTIKQSAAQLLHVVNDILNLAKAEAGELEVDLIRVDLAEVVSSLRGTIEGLARVAGLKSEIDLPADLPAVVADPLRLQEVLINLVDNAVKYTPPGGRVGVRAIRTNAKVKVAVSDTGVGIPADAADRIFEPFFRVKGIDAQQGQASSGLGLAITKRLVEAQGGEIDYESKSGEGTTFTFTLPIAKPHSSAASKKRKAGIRSS